MNTPYFRKTKVWYVSFDKQDTLEPVYLYQNSFPTADEAIEFQVRIEARGYRTSIWWQMEETVNPVPQASTRKQVVANMKMQDMKQPPTRLSDESLPSVKSILIQTICLVVALGLCFAVLWVK